jgi:AcrR family transcriptional regulator
MAKSFRNRQGAETRRQLVKIAERLFADEGVEAVSIRAVNAAAKQGAASVHYHFGSKDKLVEAVVVEHGSRVTERINERVRDLAVQPEPPTARQLVELIADPFLELLERERVRGLRWVKIIAQLTLADDPMLTHLTAQTTNAVLEQVFRAYPDVDPDRLRMRWDVAGRTLIQMLAQVDHVSPGRGPEAVRGFVADLVDFVAGGVDAIRGEARVPGSRTRARAA